MESAAINFFVPLNKEVMELPTNEWIMKCTLKLSKQDLRCQVSIWVEKKKKENGERNTI